MNAFAFHNKAPLGLALLLSACTISAPVNFVDCPAGSTEARCQVIQPPPSRLPTLTALRCTESIQFGDIIRRNPSTRWASCHNPSGKPVQIIGWALDSTSESFGLKVNVQGESARAPISLGPREILDFQISFDAEWLGHAQGTLRVQTLQPEQEELRIPIRAKVVDGPNCKLKSLPQLLDFGAVVPGHEAKASIQVYNAGVSPCSLSLISLYGDSSKAFSLENQNSWVKELDPGQSQEVTLTYEPKVEGQHLGALGIWGATGSLLSIPLRGLAVSADEQPRVEPSQLHFGQRGTQCQNPTYGSVTVYAGNQKGIVQARLSDDSSPAFTLISQNAALEIGGQVEIGLRFIPISSGPHLGRLWIKVGQKPAVYISLIGIGGDTSDTEQVFTGQPPYKLYGPPLADSVKLFVDGQQLPAVVNGETHWGVDYSNQTIVFSPKHLPRANASVSVLYQQVCVLNTCGDGRRDEGEMCDDGNPIETDACLTGCRKAHCGDGFIHAGYEDCDDGNDFTGDGCNAFCSIEACGNGVLEGDEECDDGAGNGNLPDTCRSDCTLPTCGDGIRDFAQGETCDDGNQDTSDDCIACGPAICGDGYLHVGKEECDDGNATEHDGCESDCKFTRYNVVTTEGEEWSYQSGSDYGYQPGIHMPFEFRFLGNLVRTVDLSVPGLIGFNGPVTSSVATNMPIPSGAAPNGFIAWWWDELLVKGPDPYGWIEGPRGAQVWVLRFENLEIRDPQVPNRAVELNAEVRFRQSDDSVTVQYAPLDDKGVQMGSATVGWESASGRLGADPLNCSPSCSIQEWPDLIRHIYRP